jgi:hypothetical protein
MTLNLANTVALSYSTGILYHALKSYDMGLMALIPL